MSLIEFVAGMLHTAAQNISTWDIMPGNPDRKILDIVDLMKAEEALNDIHWSGPLDLSGVDFS